MTGTRTTTSLRPTPAAEAPPKQSQVLRFAGVSKAFALGRKTAVAAVENFDLAVAEGEFVALLGPSGCGKSTVLRMAAGLDEPSGGTISIGDERPTDLSRRHELGVAFQDHALLPWATVFQNISLPYTLARRQIDRARVAELIRLIGLEGFEDARPKQLSGGMRQRVSIARALVLDPKMLLLDEPFGALDAVTRRQMNAELARVWTERRISTILVTHDVAEAVALADRVIVMTGRPGRVHHIERLDFIHPRGEELLRSPEFHSIVDRLTAMLDQGTHDR